jgi:uncharacterized protein YbjT (DUF2867 family)
LLADRQDPGVTRCVVLGATGYLGLLLADALTGAGHDVGALVRDAGSAKQLPGGVRIHPGDATDTAAVRGAVSGAEVVYFLVHSLNRPDFAEVDRRAATVLATEAASAGVRQLVYVGGPRPIADTVSAHLSSRAEIGDILVGGVVPALALQASMIIGAGSASFELLRNAARSPVLPAPAWTRRKSRPVAEADVLHYLRAAAELPSPVNGAFDVSGPETLTYLSLIRRCTRVMGLPVRPAVPAPVWSHRLAAAFAGLTTPISATAAESLFASLEHDLLPTGPGISDVVAGPPGGPSTVDNAIRAAGPLAAPPRGSGRPFVDEHLVVSAETPDAVWRAITRIGSGNDWYTLPLVWTVRGALDHLAGGAGLYRGRPADPADGDVVDFWTVVSRDDTARRLVLRADLKMPGHTLLEMSVDHDGRVTRYRQKITFTPAGPAGTLYWQLQKPLHDLVFGTMARTIARAPATPSSRTPIALLGQLRDTVRHLATRA